MPSTIFTIHVPNMVIIFPASFGCKHQPFSVISTETSSNMGSSHAAYVACVCKIHCLGDIDLKIETLSCLSTYECSGFIKHERLHRRCKTGSQIIQTFLRRRTLNIVRKYLISVVIDKPTNGSLHSSHGLDRRLIRIVWMQLLLYLAAVNFLPTMLPSSNTWTS